MPDILITRKVYTPLSTIGELHLHGEFFCWTLERPHHGADPGGIVCIPQGRYPASLYRSARRGCDVILLADVPGRTYIEMHVLNFPYQTEGCIGVGHQKGLDAVYESEAAFKDLMLEVRKWAAINVVVLDTMYMEDMRA